MSWAFLEPYYDGSHRQLVDGLVEHVDPDLHVFTLPARKWKWRMRGAALHFATALEESGVEPDGIVASSMMNLAELVALLPPHLRDRPRVVYFHENQLAYPTQTFDPRDHHFAWTNTFSALAAERVLWNSEFNRDSFLEGLERLVRKMPDARPDGLVETIRERSQVVPVPIDVARIASDTRDVLPRQGPCHVVWNHRWEHDKGPDVLLAAIGELVDRGLDFRFSVVGQRFRTVPEEFDRIRARLGDRIVAWGFLAHRRDYHRLLASADVVLSTARHEFLGLAVLEGAAAGAVPLVPDALAYPEIWPKAWRFDPRTGPGTALADRIGRVEHWRGLDPRPRAADHSWAARASEWSQVIL